MALSVANLGIDGLEEIEQIGSGGSSRVYRARQIDLDRVVAVKVLNAGHETDVARRFDRERKAMGRLSLHEGIVPVYSSGESTFGEPYLVMPYYDKGSLQDQIDNGPLDWKSAVAYVDQAAETIAAAHDEGVVHLDLKPANILLTHSGSPRIADFGIAKLLNSGKAVNTGKTTGGAAFTPAYSAPETFLDGEIGPASDVYGLGATLWALLVGHPPFLPPGDDNNLMAVIGRVVNSPIGDLRHIVPGPICDVIERAMAKHPSERYQTAREFYSALQQAAESLNGTAATPTGMEAGTSLFPAVGAAGVVGGTLSDATQTFAETPAPLGQSQASSVGYQATDPSSTQLFDGGPGPVDLPQSLASTVGGPQATPPTSSRSLLQETAEPLPMPGAMPPPAPPEPFFDLDRFRIGPILLGALACIAAISAAVWVGTRDDDGAESAAPTTTAPAAPALGEDGSDTSNTVDGASSTAVEPSDDELPPTSQQQTELPSPAATPTAAPSTDPPEVTATTEVETTTTIEGTTEAPTTSEDTTTSIETTTTIEVAAPLLPPSGLSATPSATSVSLTWSAPASGPTPDSYRVFRDDQVVGSNNQPSFTDLNIEAGETYEYTVRSVVAEPVELSEPSEPVTATIPGGELTPGATTGNLTESSIDVTITSTRCVTYTVEARVQGGGNNVVSAANGDCAPRPITATVSDLEPDTTYIFTVTVSAPGFDDATATATGTTSAVVATRTGAATTSSNP